MTRSKLVFFPFCASLALLFFACGEGGGLGGGGSAPDASFCAASCETDEDCGSGGGFDLVCDEGICVNESGFGCRSDDDCGGLTCNTSTGTCECTEDSQCPGSLICTSGGFCGCNDDSQCDGLGTDSCMDGVCGCTSDATCEELNGFGVEYSCVDPR